MRRTSFGNVRWIGGASGAGKSTIAQKLASQFELGAYSTDEAIGPHAAKTAPVAPLLTEFLKMSLDERWLLRSPEEMLATFPWFAGERFDSVLDDLRARSQSSITLAEGFRLVPRLVHPVLDELWHAVWLIPTEDFRRAAFNSRPATDQFWRRTSDPATALENLLRRDALFAEEVCRQADLLDLRVIQVDGTQSVDDLAATVADWFRLLNGGDSCSSS